MEKEPFTTSTGAASARQSSLFAYTRTSSARTGARERQRRRARAAPSGAVMCMAAEAEGRCCSRSHTSKRSQTSAPSSQSSSEQSATGSQRCSARACDLDRRALIAPWTAERWQQLQEQRGESKEGNREAASRGNELQWLACWAQQLVDWERADVASLRRCCCWLLLTAPPAHRALRVSSLQFTPWHKMCKSHAGQLAGKRCCDAAIAQ